MSQLERDAIAAICLMAAFADGQPDDRERARIKTVVDGLSTDGGTPGADVSNQVYQRVIFRQTSAAQEAAQLSMPELKQLAYEMAVSVCDADGVASVAEQKFLTDLASACGISPEDAARHQSTVDQMSSVPMGSGGGGGASAAGASVGAAPSAAISSAAVAASQLDKDIDSSVRNYAILNGALELLPSGLASAAIIPLQMKMVYEIGKRYGYTLDRGHIKDFLATAGVGVTSQVVEGFASRIVGGLIENVGGRLIGRGAAGMLSGLGRAATGTAFAFATTYALGQVAKQYYAGGRTLSAIDLQAVFTKQSASAKGMYDQYRPRIEEQARNLNPSQILNMVRGA